MVFEDFFVNCYAFGPREVQIDKGHREFCA